MVDKKGKLARYRRQMHKVQQLKKDNESEVIDMIIEANDNADTKEEE